MVRRAAHPEGSPYLKNDRFRSIIDDGEARMDELDRTSRLQESMQQVMGPLPDDARRVPLDVRIDGEERLGKVLRRRLSFAVEPGDRVPAYLLLPLDVKHRVAAVLCLHQTTSIGKGEPAGVGGLANLHYALELAERGFVTLAPDYPNFGDYRCDPYKLGYASATMKGIWNHMRAVDLLQSMDAVDPDRIGCIGHSLGGHNTLFLGAFDPRVKAMATSCGFTAFSNYQGGNLKGWSHAGYMPRMATEYGCTPRNMPFDFPDVIASLAPRALFVNAPKGDDNFDVSGVADCLVVAAKAYERAGAADRLAAVFPDGGHDFGRPEREAAYAFFGTALKAYG